MAVTAALAGTAQAAPTLAGPPAAAGSGSGKDVAGLHDAPGKGRSDNLQSPMAVKQAANRQAALQRKVQGDPAAQGKVVKVGKGQYVKLANEGTDRIFVLVVEFGNEQYPNPTFQGPPADGSTTDVTGPLHNEIPAPDRSVDNTTLWQADYTPAHYQDMYFNRMKTYYETQSSGATRSAATSRAGSRCPSTRRSTAGTTAAASSATPARRWCVTLSPSGSSSS